ncbi:hypothetical protein MSG28_015546 [Choristoneura fumiferana]|uniref:Uncharacterized protein n=1 Tax=Choristoneura fumiferana TaxID=7141 RepID=A0ACC0KAP1_CHOFU|nr:hypothetical protein MSG28_015546 [Choristoneura fumiferana]
MDVVLQIIGREVSRCVRAVTLAACKEISYNLAGRWPAMRPSFVSTRALRHARGPRPATPPAAAAPAATQQGDASRQLDFFIIYYGTLPPPPKLPPAGVNGPPPPTMLRHWTKVAVARSGCLSDVLEACLLSLLWSLSSGWLVCPGESAPGWSGLPPAAVGTFRSAAGVTKEIAVQGEEHEFGFIEQSDE